jgi:hypothetical protein
MPGAAPSTPGRLDVSAKVGRFFLARDRAAAPVGLAPEAPERIRLFGRQFRSVSTGSRKILPPPSENRLTSCLASYDTRR